MSYCTPLAIRSSTESQQRSILYEEPEITTVLIVSGFMLSLNAINWAFDHIAYCGLVGQIFVGLAFGTPGLQWLSASFEHAIVQFGYLGLLLLVYEGGLSTDMRLLRSNIWLSSGIAITGIAIPIALSFALKSMLNITSLQAFAAGAALCSTSLGTTFTILQTTDLSRSNLGVVLAGAAMMDDVVGLVLVQIISSLGSSPSISSATVVRPIGVSIAYAVLTPLVCLFAGRPSNRQALHNLKAILTKTGLPDQAVVLFGHTVILAALVTSSSYAGTSNLFAAYLAGAGISWWESLRPEQNRAPTVQRPTGDTQGLAASGQDPPGRAGVAESSQTSDSKDTEPHHTGSSIYRRYCRSVVDCVLRPFFFASIGFSIPIANMFEGPIVWRGVIYTILMLLAKMVCGLWLLPLSLSTPSVSAMKATARYVSSAMMLLRHKHSKGTANPTQTATVPTNPRVTARPDAPAESKRIEKPQSLYPGALVGCAMAARGEIGFLVSAVAQSSGLYTTGSGDSNLFLTVTWAIMLCTIVGPVLTGLLTKRVWKLQHDERSRQSGRQDPLGVWGASS